MVTMMTMMTVMLNTLIFFNSSRLLIDA